MLIQLSTYIGANYLLSVVKCNKFLVNETTVFLNLQTPLYDT